MNFLKQNYGLTVLAQCVTCRGKNVHQNEVSVGAICLNRWGQLNVYVLIVWDYDRERLIIFQCFLVSSQF